MFCATAGLQAAWELLNEVREGGGAALHAWNGRANASKWGRAQQSKLVGAARIRQIEDKYLPKEAQRDYVSTWGHRVDFSTDRENEARPRAGAAFVTLNSPSAAASFRAFDPNRKSN